MTEKRIELDPSELLGLSQVAHVSGNIADPVMNARLLSKNAAGGEFPPPDVSFDTKLEIAAGTKNARLLSKIGNEVTDT